MIKSYLYISLLILCGYLSFVYNQTVVISVNAAFGIGVTGASEDQIDQDRIRTPADFVDLIAEDLLDVDSLSDREKDVVVQGIPATIDYESRNRGPYTNIYDFSVFDNKDKHGGILVVGDSTMSWGFSISHFSEIAETEVHGLTFGLNAMDDALLLATDRVIECYYAKSPTVMVSHALRSIDAPIRLRREQDQAIVEISKTSNCKQLYRLVSQNRKTDTTASSGDQRKTENSQPGGFWRFRNYRAAVASIEPEIGYLKHVELHKIMEDGIFEEMDNSAWSFYRWQPEYRIPFRHDEFYDDIWRPSSHEEERTYFLKYVEEHPDSIEVAASNHRSWARKNACFVLPLTKSAESGVRKHFIPDDVVCQIDFPAIAGANYPSLAIKMNGNHHYAASGGIVFAALAGKYIKSRQLPTWQ